MRVGVREGKTLGSALGPRSPIPPLAAHLIRVGEEGGRLDDVLVQIADIYDAKFELAVKRLLGVLEPACVIVLGIFIVSLLQFFSLSSRSMSSRSRFKSSAGFTLVELLVVLVILGLLAALVAPRVLSYLGSSKTKTAQLQITSFADALDLYRLDNQRRQRRD
jgi:prepilin-type N-terminal cleavage/methylation domain-containing protein